MLKSVRFLKMIKDKNAERMCMTPGVEHKFQAWNQSQSEMKELAFCLKNTSVILLQRMKMKQQAHLNSLAYIWMTFTHIFQNDQKLLRH